MNRKNFISTLIFGICGAAVAPFVKSNRNRIISGDATNSRLFIGQPVRPKLGYISVSKCPEGTHCGDWTVYCDNICISSKQRIQSADDINGYYTYLDQERTKRIHPNLRLRVENQNIRFVYKGNNPKYKMYV